MAWSVVTPPTLSSSFFNTCSSTSTNSFLPLTYNYTSNNNNNNNNNNTSKFVHIYKKTKLSSNKQTICRAAEYQFPDPIPEFAFAETEKFKAHLMNKLSKKARYGDELEEVVTICTEILGKFLHEEYGGPGTLLVLPFAMMAEAVTESGLTGGPQAARAAVKWAQANVDKDWKDWANGNYSADP